MSAVTARLPSLPLLLLFALAAALLVVIAFVVARHPGAHALLMHFHGKVHHLVVMHYHALKMHYHG